MMLHIKNQQKHKCRFCVMFKHRESIDFNFENIEWNKAIARGGVEKSVIFQVFHTFN